MLKIRRGKKYYLCMAYQKKRYLSPSSCNLRARNCTKTLVLDLQASLVFILPVPLKASSDILVAYFSQ